MRTIEAVIDGERFRCQVSGITGRVLAYSLERMRPSGKWVRVDSLVLLDAFWRTYGGAFAAVCETEREG